MISGFRVRTIRVGIPYQAAMAMIKTAAREQGFEITETLNLEDYVRRHIADNSRQRTTMMQMHKPGITLQSVLLGDLLPLLLPVRIVLREENRKTSLVDLPHWEVVRDPERGSADYCMNMLYRDSVEGLAAVFFAACTWWDVRDREESAKCCLSGNGH